jgi:DNA repair exonuclease SbcCD ATPase subunit
MAGEEQLGGLAAAILRKAQEEAAQQRPTAAPDTEAAAATPVEVGPPPRPEGDGAATMRAHAEIRKSKRRGLRDLISGLRGTPKHDASNFPATHRFTHWLSMGKRRDSKLGNLPATIGSINEQIAEDLMRYQELKGEHEAIREELRRVREEQAALKKELARLTAEKTREKARLETQNGLLEARITKLQGDDLKKQQKLKETVDKLTRDLDTERGRTRKLGEELSDAVQKGKASESDYELAKGQLEVMTEQLQQMRELVSGTGHLDSAYKAAVERLGKEKGLLQQRVDSLEASLSGVRETSEALERAQSQIGELEAQRDNLNSEVQRLTAALDDVKIIDKRPEAVAQLDETRIGIGRAMVAIFDKLPSLERDANYEALIAALKRATELSLGTETKSAAPELRKVLSALVDIDATLSAPLAPGDETDKPADAPAEKA